MASDSDDDDVYAQSYGLGHDQHTADSQGGPVSENESEMHPDDSQSSSDSEDGFQRANTANGGAADSTTSESSSDSEDSQSPNRRQLNRFLDLEASESEPESTAESFADWDDSDPLLSVSFTDFMRLPVELREMIWTEFCPDLQSQPRVFEFILSGNDYIVPSPQMEFQTEPTRIMLAIHRESRRLALRSSPDHISLPHGAAYVPYNKERDIIYLDVSMNRRGPAPGDLKSISRMAPGMQNLAIPADCDYEEWRKLPDDLPSIRNIFVLAEAVDICTHGLTWCASKGNLEYQIDFEETELGMGVDITTMLFCWPNTNKLGGAGEAKFKRHVGQIVTYPWNRYESPEPEDSDFEGIEATDTEYPGETKARAWGRRMNELRKRYSVHSAVASASSGLTVNEYRLTHPLPSVWPMVRFMDDNLERLQEIKDWQLPWKDWVSEEGSSEETDEYESDGIDDFQYDDDILPTDIEDEFGADIPYDGLPLASDTEDESTAHILDQFTHEGLSADAHDQEDDYSDTSRRLERNRTARPRRNILDSDSEEGDSDENATRSNDRNGNGKRRARPVVVDSDSGDEPSTVAAHNHVDKRRRRAISSDSDSQDENSDDSDGQDDPSSHRSAKRRKFVALPSDSEDDDDQDAVAPPPNKTGNRRAHNSVSSSSESEQDSSASSEEDESSDDEPAPRSKKPSLAKRLQMEYRQARADYDAEHDSGDDDSMANSEHFEEFDGISSDGHGSAINMAEEAQEEEEADDDIDEEDW